MANIVLLAPAGGMTFASMPSGSVYVSDENGLIITTSVPDQIALIIAGCITLNPLPGGGYNTQNGTAYTVVAADNGNLLLFTNTGAVTVTFAATLPVGFRTRCYLFSSGSLTLASAAGASINSPLGVYSISIQYYYFDCTVVSQNGSNTAAVWDVVIMPTPGLGSGIVGATSLSALYSQDTTNHYAQYTTGNVYNDGTPANDGTWLKTGTGNGSGNWTQVSTATLNALSTALTSEISRAETAEASLRTPQQQLFANTNAVRRKFSGTVDPDPQSKDSVNQASWAVRTYSSAMAFNASVYSTFGEPQALLLSQAAGTAGAAAPLGGYWISPADLATIGIVPSDSSPPVISAEAAIDVASAVNQTLDTISNSANGQVWLFLRYAGPNGPTDLSYNVATDVQFANACTHATNGPGGATTDSHWSGVMSSAVFSTGNVKGYAFNNIELPLTFAGQTFTGIGIYVIGRVTANGATSFQSCLGAVVAGSSIVPAQAYFNPDDHPATYVPETNVVRRLDVATADKVILLGDSHGASYYALQNKSWIKKFSLFSDWNVENYSESGDTLQKMLWRIRSGALTFGLTNFQEPGVRRVLICSELNDSTHETLPQFVNDLKQAVETVRMFGAVPMIVSEDNSAFGNGIQTLFRSVAEEMGVDFIDLTRWWKLFNQPGSQYAGFFLGGHPGVRANELLSEPVELYFRGIERPQQSFKIFRKRTGVSAGTSPYDALLFDSAFERAQSFKEIEIGEYALTSPTYNEYYDSLGGGGYTESPVPSEYLYLLEGEPVSFADFGLIEAIFPHTPAECRLVLSDPNIQVFVRDALATPFPSSAIYQGFAPSGSPSISAGAVYTSNDGYFGAQNFTFVATINGLVMFTPFVSGATARGAGTLTKVSGTGDATIGYNTAAAGFDATYYAQYGKPIGHWTQLTGTNGVFVLTAADMRGKLRHDKLSFLLYESGGFSLTNPRIMWRAIGGPKTPARNPLRRVGMDRPARGSELLTTNSLASLTGWTQVGSPMAGTAADSMYPNNPTTGVEFAGLVNIDGNDYVKQAFTYTADYNLDRAIEVTVFVRNFPPIHTVGVGSSPITPDTCDYGLLEIDLITAVGTCPYNEKVGLWWKEVKFRTVLPIGATSATLQILPSVVPANGQFQVCWASVKLVDA